MLLIWNGDCPVDREPRVIIWSLLLAERKGLQCARRKTPYVVETCCLLLLFCCVFITVNFVDLNTLMLQSEMVFLYVVKACGGNAIEVKPRARSACRLKHCLFLNPGA